MNPVAVIGMWVVLWLGSHLVLSSSQVRPRLTAAIGEQPYRGVYSLVAFATLGPLIYEFATHKHSGALLWYLREDDWARGLTWLLVLLSFVMLVSAFTTPSPTAIGGGAPTAPRGILKIARHPSFVAFGLWGVGHLLMNGWLGDVIFFAAFPALGVVGGMHQDSRKLSELGEPYRDFMNATSFIPGMALIRGKSKLTVSDIPWIGIAIGVLLTVILIWLHPYLFGGDPQNWAGTD